MLDLQEFLILKKNLESRLMDLINKETDAFLANTGQAPHTMNCKFNADLMVIEVKTKFTLLGEVEV